jgi:hypothetical protein
MLIFFIDSHILKDVHRRRCKSFNQGVGARNSGALLLQRNPENKDKVEYHNFTVSAIQRTNVRKPL